MFYRLLRDPLQVLGQMAEAGDKPALYRALGEGTREDAAGKLLHLFHFCEQGGKGLLGLFAVDDKEGGITEEVERVDRPVPKGAQVLLLRGLRCGKREDGARPFERRAQLGLA